MILSYRSLAFFNRARIMAARAAAHPEVAKLLRDADTEGTAVWQDYGGLWLKSRPDIVSRRYPIAADLKTCLDASPEAFTRTVARYGYHFQAAMGLDGLARIGMPHRYWLLIAIEKLAPYDVMVHELTPDFLAIGRRDYLLALDRLRGLEAHEFPGYDQTINKLHPPAYLYKTLEQSE